MTFSTRLNRFLLMVVPHIVFTAISSTALTVDTTIIADGSPGPYVIGRFFVDTTTISVCRNDSGFVPQFTYINDLNGLLFSDPIDSGVVLHIKGETDFYGLPKIYYLYEKRYLEQSDTSFFKDTNLILPQVFNQQHDNIAVSGYKTLGVSIGTFGQVNLEQELDVVIGGEVRPGTEISAHLNDQGTSLDGTTREISEFDRIFITLANPAYTIVAGDQYLQWPIEGILSNQKKIKGLSATVHPESFKTGIFGALSGGNFTVQTWRGEKGQGPYAFIGNGESGFITPISQTVHITINGKTIKEGQDNDFIVDYDLGTVIFTPRILINPEDIIRAEYEYKLFDYQRTITGGELSKSLGDSLLTVQAAIWGESDNKNNPIELVLTKDNMRTLEQSGDKPPMDTSAYSVDPNDVLDLYASVPLYAKVDTNGMTIFIHKQPDRSGRVKNDSLFDVHFTEIDSCGDYSRSIFDGEYIFTYVGSCNGSYMPLTPLSAPKRLVFGEMMARFRLSFLDLTADIAGQEHDKNLFSSINDNDNLSSATHLTALLGRKSFEKRSLWLSGDFHSYSSGFNREAFSAYDRKFSWNDTSLYKSEIPIYQWEVASGMTPFAGFSTEMGYGQQNESSKTITDKFTGNTQYRPLTWLTGTYSGTYFRHFEKEDYGTGHQQHAGLSFNNNFHSAGLLYRDEWKSDVSGIGFGLLEGKLHYDFNPLNLSEELTTTRFRQGKNGLLYSPDTASAISWKQVLNCKPFKRWRINGTSTWQTRRNLTLSAPTKSSTMLIDFTSETGQPSSSFSSIQHYRTTAERASRYIQIPILVSEGKGTHVWDSTLHEYVQDPQEAGNFIIQQREILDSTNNLKTRKSEFSLTWSYKPDKKGFLDVIKNFTFDGFLFLEEHIDADIKRSSSWCPGYISLKNLGSPNTNWEKIRYSDLSYRQEIGWSPSSDPGFKAALSLQPNFQYVRTFRESSSTIELSAERRNKKYLTQSEIHFFSLSHNDTSGTSEDYEVRDMYLLYSRTRHLSPQFDLSAMSCLGVAFQNKTGKISPYNLFNNSIYFQGAPSFTWIPRNNGRIEVEYTFSIVDILNGHDYRIARGFASGISHTVTFSGSIAIGKSFMLNGSYRGEMYRSRLNGRKQPSEHIMSLEIQAFIQ